MVVNHGGENGHQSCNILDNHPQRKKRHYHKPKPKASQSNAQPAEEVTSPMKRVFRKPMHIIEMQWVKFSDLPAWVHDTILDVLLINHADHIDRLNISELQTTVQYVLGNEVATLKTSENLPAVELCIPGTRLKSIVTVNEIVSCFV